MRSFRHPDIHRELRAVHIRHEILLHQSESAQGDEKHCRNRQQEQSPVFNAERYKMPVMAVEKIIVGFLLVSVFDLEAVNTEVRRWYD